MAHLRSKVVCRFFHGYFCVYSVIWTLSRATSQPFPNELWSLSGHSFGFIIITGQTGVPYLFFCPLACVLFLLLSQHQLELITLKVGVGNYDNTAKSGWRLTAKGRLVLNPQGVACSKRAMQNLYARPKSQNYAQTIVCNGASRGHIEVLDTGSQNSMVGMGGW